MAGAAVKIWKSDKCVFSEHYYVACSKINGMGYITETKDGEAIKYNWRCNRDLDFIVKHFPNFPNGFSILWEADNNIQSVSKNQKHKCYCPPENFRYNSIGCRCGGI